MTTIGIISDTHGYLDENVFRHFEPCDEVWHAGDFGSPGVAQQLEGFRPLRAVSGNIDGPDLRHVPEKQHFLCEAVPVFMVHIGGYPGKYAPGIKEQIRKHKSRLFISGHSHILKVMFDESLQCLHINPGAAGRQGWHKIRTLVRLQIDGSAIQNGEVIELGAR